MSDIEVIARGACFRDGRVLVCRNLKHGYAFLPGGHVEFGEAARVALAREMWEEARATVAVGPCLLVTEGSFTGKRPHHEVNLVFRVELVGETEVQSVEPEIGFEWIDLAAVIHLDLRPAAVKAWIVAGPDTDRVEWVSEIPDTD